MAENTFRTLEIIVQAATSAPGGARSWPVVARLIDSDQTAASVLTLPFGPGQLDEALKWIEDGLFDDDFVREFGGQLFDALFAGGVGDLYRELRRPGETRPRLRIITGDSQMARVPWELLYDRARQTFVALDVPVVRSLPLAGETRPLATAAYPLRVLVAEAFPRGLPAVQGEAETRSIAGQLGGLVRQRRVEVTRLPHVTLGKLQNALREAAAARRPFHVLHVIGHGRSDRRTGKSALLFEDDDGGPQEIAPATLAPLLAEFDVKLAFLNACQSAQSSAFDLADGFAPALLGAGTPCVIGMQVSVLDDVARQFAAEFYAALADNQPVDQALTHARRLVLGEGPRRKADMAIPVCYLRPPSGQILDLRAPEAVPLTRGTLVPWLQHNLRPGRLLRSVYGVIAVIGTILGLYLAVDALAPKKELGEMNGVFNVAVAGFGKLDSQGGASEWRKGSQLAGDFCEELQSAIAQEQPGVQVWGPAQVGTITGDTPKARLQNAQKWAADHNVDLLIHGTVHSERTSAEILPEFYVAEQRLPFAPELMGSFDLNAVIAVTGENVLPDANRLAWEELRGKLLNWVSEFADFALGLDSFNQNQFEDALRYLTVSAAEDGDEDRAQWRKVVNLFRGSAAGLLGRHDEAAAYYDKALAIDPAYVRALLGKGQAAFLRARQDCSQASQTDVEGLQEALRFYQQAADARAESEAEIEVKVNYFSGAAQLCLELATEDATLAESLRRFSAVIDEYQARTNDPTAQGRIAYLAAAAYTGRGAAYAVLSNFGADGDALARAQADFAAAREITSRNDRKAVASWWLGRLYLWNNACPLASEEIARGDSEIQQYVKDNPTTRLDDAATLRCPVAGELAKECPDVALEIPTVISCPAGAK